MEFSISTRNIHEKNLLLSGHNIVIQVLQVFIDIIPDTTTLEKEGRSVEGTILALARIDAFIATCLTFL